MTTQRAQTYAWTFALLLTATALAGCFGGGDEPADEGPAETFWTHALAFDEPVTVDGEAVGTLSTWTYEFVQTDPATRRDPGHLEMTVTFQYNGTETRSIRTNVTNFGPEGRDRYQATDDVTVHVIYAEVQVTRMEGPRYEGSPTTATFEVWIADGQRTPHEEPPGSPAFATPLFSGLVWETPEESGRWEYHPSDALMDRLERGDVDAIARYLEGRGIARDGDPWWFAVSALFTADPANDVSPRLYISGEDALHPAPGADSRPVETQVGGRTLPAVNVSLSLEPVGGTRPGTFYSVVAPQLPVPVAFTLINRAQDEVTDQFSYRMTQATFR